MNNLNDVETSLNEWGRIAVSDMDFVPNKGQFKVTFNEDVTNYVQAARSNISGDASSVQQSALYLGFLMQGTYAPPVSLGSPSASTNLPNQSSIPNQAQTAVNNFPPGLSLSGLNPVNDERAAMQKGINDKIAETLLEFMASPSASSNQQVVVFGVMQATCEPGQYTRQGYIAELNVSLKYARKKELPNYSTSLPLVDPNIIQGIDANTKSVIYITNRPAPDMLTHYIEDKYSQRFFNVGTTSVYQVGQKVKPGILAVLPLMDSRNMEFRNSNQSQTELAIALSAAFAARGANAAANLLSDYVKRQESNTDTRNSLPVATTFTDGANFGFQLYPSLQALENPGKAGSSSGDVLEPVTFPIVVAFLVEKDQVTKNQENENDPFTHLVMETQTRWIPINHTLFLNKKLGDGWPLVERLKRAKEIDDAQIELMKLYPAGAEFPQTIPLSYRKQYQQLQIAMDSLRTSALSVESARPLPDANEMFPPITPDNGMPKIIDVYPHSIWRDTDTQFTILLGGVAETNEIKYVIVGGAECKVRDVVCFGTNDATLNPPKFKSQGIVIIATFPQIFNSVTNSATNNIEFAVVFNDQNKMPAVKSIPMILNGKASPEAIASINRDGNGRIMGIDVRPGQNVTEQQLLSTIKEILEKSESPPKSTTIVH